MLRRTAARDRRYKADLFRPFRACDLEWVGFLTRAFSLGWGISPLWGWEVSGGSLPPSRGAATSFGPRRASRG